MRPEEAATLSGPGTAADGSGEVCELWCAVSSWNPPTSRAALWEWRRPLACQPRSLGRWLRPDLASLRLSGACAAPATTSTARSQGRTPRGQGTTLTSSATSCWRSWQSDRAAQRPERGRRRLAATPASSVQWC